MYRYLCIFLIIIFFSYPSFAHDCFIAKEKDEIIISKGECGYEYAPNSTFKIVLSLIGFDSGLLRDEKRPMWNYKSEYAASIPSHQQNTNPSLWMKNSVVWYSQELTKKLGMKKFQEYIKLLDYGNKDLSGDAAKNNGLSRSWLSSSLKISPIEQVEFLEKLNKDSLPVSKKSMKITRKIMFVETLPNGWNLYGKTGSGYQANPNGSPNENLHFGWFVGWIEKDNRKIIFAKYIEDEVENKSYAGPRAKEAVKEAFIQDQYGFGL